jgi:hypothetical protein
MLMAGTPCPFEGKIGKEAIAQWNKYDVERPDYKAYVSKLETRSQIDAELAAIEQAKIDEAIIKEEEKAKKLKKEAKLLEEALIKKNLPHKENVIIKIHK